MPEDERFERDGPSEVVDDFAEDEDAADLPERDALSLIDPTSLLGGTGGGLPLGGTQPTTGTTPTDPTSAAPAPTPAPMPPTTSPIPLPQMPNLPHDNPGGTYQPDASSTSTTDT